MGTAEAADPFIRAATTGAAELLEQLGGAGEVDEDLRLRLPRLSAGAAAAARDALGLPIPGDGRWRLAVTNRRQWLARTLSDYRPVLGWLAALVEDDAETESGGDEAGRRLTEHFESLHQGGAMGIFAMLTGMMLGDLAPRAVGSYELPVPRPEGSAVLIPAPNLLARSQDWGVSLDLACRWACWKDAVHHLALSRPHVGTRVSALLAECIRTLDVGQEALIRVVSITAPARAGGGAVDEKAMLATMQPEVRNRPMAELAAITGILEAHAWLSAEREGYIEGGDALGQALARERAGKPLRYRLIEVFLGLRLGAEEFEAGAAFVSALAAADPTFLRHLWADEALLPTPEDVADPERWISRARS